MSITKNVFRLNETYDLIRAGCISYTLTSADPGTLWVWGYNNWGTLGNNTTANYSSPIQIPGTAWLESCGGGGGGGSTVALKSDNTMWVWGSDTYGQLGLGASLHRSSPVQVPGTAWCRAGVADRVIHAIKTNGTLWGMGRNLQGLVGDGTKTHRSSPVQIPGTQWCCIKSNGNDTSAAAFKSDSTVWAWGENSYGQLGNNNRNQFSSPIQIPGTWLSYVQGYNTGLGVKTDNALWSWGYNLYGAIGDNTRVHKSSPVQIPGTLWCKVSSGNSFNLALKTDGTMWAWGFGGNGALGNNSTVHRSSPVQIPGSQWSNIIDSNYCTPFALKTDGTVWTWGDNTYSALGDGTSTQRSSPVQLPGTWITNPRFLFFSSTWSGARKE